jgi:hypothetical protein
MTKRNHSGASGQGVGKSLPGARTASATSYFISISRPLNVEVAECRSRGWTPSTSIVRVSSVYSVDLQLNILQCVQREDWIVRKLEKDSQPAALPISLSLAPRSRCDLSRPTHSSSLLHFLRCGDGVGLTGGFDPPYLPGRWVENRPTRGLTNG